MAENWTLRKQNQKYLESFEIRYWRRKQEISWPDRVKNEKKKKSITTRQGGKEHATDN